MGGGLSEGAQSLHDFYLSLAQQATPVIEVGAAKEITVIVSEGKELEIREIENDEALVKIMLPQPWLLLFLVSACAPVKDVINPYNEDFKCRAKDDARQMHRHPDRVQGSPPSLNQKRETRSCR